MCRSIRFNWHFYLTPALVRFPNPLALGSGLGLHCLSKWRIFLCSPPAWTIVIGHGQWGAYWIPPHLTKPLAQFHFCSLTCLAASTPFLSSFRSQLLPPSDCNFCSTGMQLDLSSCCFIFLLCYPSKQPSWALSDGINVKSEKNQFLSLSLSDKWQGFWFGWVSGENLWLSLLFYHFLW